MRKAFTAIELMIIIIVVIAVVEHKCPFCGCRLGFVVTAVSKE